MKSQNPASPRDEVGSHQEISPTSILKNLVTHSILQVLDVRLVALDVVLIPSTWME